MGFIFGLIKRLIKLLIKLALFLAVFVAVIVLIPNLPPYSKFSSIALEPTLPRVGPLAPNGALNNVDKLYKNKLLGPEAFQVYNGDVYTSLATGEIVKLSNGHVTFVTKIGEPCTGITQAHKCGRPLGFAIDEKTQQMYVSDAYYGIWRVDLKTDKKQLLVSPRVAIEGRSPKVFNSLALGKNGDFYWTDSTSEFDLRNGAFSMLADPSGRLFHYNSAKNQSKVLLDDLWFPNGVVLSPDKQFIVVAETARLRLIKYYLEGPKKGKSEVFVAGLPGTPDNLRALPDGSGVLVALYAAFDEEHPLVARSMSEAPLARKFLARLQRLVEIPFEFLNEHYPNVVFENIVHHIGHFESVAGLLPGLAGLVQLDWNGNIVASYYNTDGSNPEISDAVVFNNKLYMGSPNGQNYIASVPAPPLLSKAFGGTQPPHSEPTKEQPKPKDESVPKPSKVVKEKEVPKVTKPVTQETPKVQPKPTEPAKTTTPKPVETKPTEPKVATPPPKQAESKPSTPASKQSKPAEDKGKPPSTPPKQPETRTAPPPKETKPAATKTESTTPMPKAETKPQKPADKPTQAPQADIKQTGAKPQKQDKPVPEQIPIKEEIPSDTAKPSKETLKVIKKSGPTEIPNPSL